MTIVRLLTLVALGGLVADPGRAQTTDTAEKRPSAEAGSPRTGPGWSSSRPEKGPFVETEHGYMVPYRVTLPGSEVSFEMVPIPGGRFLMGSPESEEGREDDEGPRVAVTVEPFWMGKHEVTWKEYQEFMGLYDVFKEFVMLRSMLASFKDDEVTVRRQEQLRELLKTRDALRSRIIDKTDPADAITAPTKLYEPDTTYQYGSEPDQPAVTMTQYAAKHYTKWLSKITGIDYRLPREAEWEYACRAGTTTAYHFGDDPSMLGDYAWYYENGDEQLHDVGKKKPNPWGLHDMHGNVSEWVLDAYSEQGYEHLAGKKEVTAAQSVNWPTKAFPRAIRGGNWDAEPLECRSAVRMGSSEDWKSEDPNLPLSPWWFTTEPAHCVGFRLLRPLEPLTAEERVKVWHIDAPLIKTDVQIRLEEGRGAEDAVDARLPEAIKQLDVIKKQMKLEAR